MSATRGILGVWDGHDASVALVADGELVFALSEERPSRRKRYSGFPALAIDRCLQWAAEHRIEIADVALAARTGRTPHRLLEPLYARTDPHRDPLSLASRIVERWDGLAPRLPIFSRVEPALGAALFRQRIAKHLRRSFRLRLIEHHEAHAFSALWGAARKSALVVTWDSYGEGRAATVRSADDPLNVRAALGTDAALATLYGAVTTTLGFREGDEGKVMGLAAHGDPSRGLSRFLDLFSDRDGAPSLRHRLTRSVLANLCQGLCREDVAAALQEATERLAVRWIRRLRDESGARSLLLAGGLFANVRLNQALAGIAGIDELFVFPNMGDGGLSAGAAHRVWLDRSGSLATPTHGALLGWSPSEGDLERALRERRVSFRRLASPSLEAAEHLAKGRVVCSYSGRDEFGPRALGNRSILFSPRDPSMGARVNRALGRDGFMPFAPAIRVEDADTVLRPLTSSPDLSLMTTAATATPAFQSRCRGAVHVDGTVRPQLVAAEASPRLHEVLTGFRALTGLEALVNTSFNLHGEPIVHTPVNAIDTFLRSGLDVLLLGGFEVVKPEMSRS